MDPVILYGGLELVGAGSSSVPSTTSTGFEGVWSCHSSEMTLKRTISLLSKYMTWSSSFHTQRLSDGSLVAC